LAENVKNLMDHVLWNGIENCRIYPIAVAGECGFASFLVAASNSMGRVGLGDGFLQVPTISLDHLLSETDVPTPDFVKMDVEGAEASVLAGAARLLEQRRTVWFISLHGQDQKAACGNILNEAGYAITAVDGTAVPGKLEEWDGDEVFASPRG
jgi:FkbM family methyltransferase